jgi:probable rRNA maturation factor
MKPMLDLQYALEGPEADIALPAAERFERWVAAAIGGRREEAELTVRIVGEAEGTELNEHYRPEKTGPTNVLSFPFEAPEGVTVPLLGDIVICAPVVLREAAAQEKPPEAHWAHLVVHGCLHLLGYDHIEPEQALEMETLETEILAGLGYSDPYGAQR